ncbi:MAG: hypothetical protein IPP31_07055 [Chitinophagaceae bacterium]|nr:hypothetical protein [Chitinophagaceae bacterium]
MTEALNSLKFDFSSNGRRAVLSLLEQCSRITFNKAADFTNYHRQLLFLLAYPGDEKIRSLAKAEMERFNILLNNNQQLSRPLDNSGLPGTRLYGSFSYTLTNDFFRQPGTRLTLESVDGDKESIMQMLYPAFSGIEKERLSEESLTWNKWIRSFGGRSDQEQLSFLLKQLERAYPGMEQREAVFSSFKLFTGMRLENEFAAFSADAGRHTRIFHHTHGLSRAAGVSPFSPPANLFTKVRVTANDKRELVDLARKTICPFFKETDPFTYAAVEETEYFTADRGITIALYYMIPEKKLELECYCGYLMLKNNIPVAYGGGWILGSQCRFGLNILPAFRGGESTLLFNRLLQLYARHFNIQSFLIEPFQLGKGNPEGLQSASFWFYYKMGFRPMQAELAEQAATEFRKLRSDKGARTSLPVLKKLSDSIMRYGKPDQPFYDINAISENMTRHIQTHHQNDRDQAGSFLPGLLNEMLEEKNRLKESEIASLQKINNLKPKREHQATLSLQKSKRFLLVLSGFR